MQSRCKLTSSVVHVFGTASFECSVPVVGVVSPPAHLLTLLPGLFHPRGSEPPSRPARLLKHSAHDAEPSSVRQRSPAAHLGSYRRVPAPSGSGAAVPDKAGVQEHEAPGRQVEEDEGEESHGFPAEVALYLQQRLGHVGSPCHSDTLSQ